MHGHHTSGGYRPSQPSAHTSYRYGHGGRGMGLYRGHVPIGPSIHQAAARHRSSPSRSAASRSAAPSGTIGDKAEDSGWFGVLLGCGAVWWAVAHLIHVAHHHHESALAFIYHSVVGRLT